MKRIFLNQEACIGCGLCEVHCIIEHSKSKDPIKAYRRVNPHPVSRVRVEVDKPSSISVQCQHCKDTPCVFACLSNAMILDRKTGLVMHDAEKCMGCWSCIMVCPYGAIKPDVSGTVVAKCDLCPNLEVPPCVANCPNEALVYEEMVS